ncbi:HD family phosphohydrolase [Peribacillus cavernae]|uniref:HD family phosphohydrolase n=1 Tax=Peribacillus cavernae TaxID=1674310 RepID=UPI001FE381A0|nr:HD family phosphohydrolase [Peribacillus cavernae]MDQ0218264.1 putative nucleotidyltransferase with HDIG domain [Peribacillus cavernae]
MNFIQANLTRLRALLGNRLFQILLFVVLGIFAYLMMYSNVKPEKVKIELLKPAEQTIRSTKTVEDTYKTEQEKEEITQQVADVYTLKKEYAQNKVDLIASIFDSALEVKKETSPEDPESAGKDENENNSSKTATPAEKTVMLKQKLTDEVNKEIPESVFLALVEADEDDLKISKDLTITAVNNVMSQRITAADVENAKKRAEEELKYTSLDNELKNASISLARNAIIQNVFFDKDKTEVQRTQAVETIEPIKILQGQIIVEEGQLIDREVYRQLELAGFLNNDKTVFPYLGLFLFLTLITGALYYYFYLSNNTEDRKVTQMLVFSLVLMLSLSVMKIFSLFSDLKYVDLGYYFPAAMAAMLIKNLLHERFAAAITIILGAFGTIIFNGDVSGNLDFSIGLYIMFSGLAAIIILSKKNFKTKILQAGLLLSVINVVLLFSILFIMDGNYSKMEYLFYMIAAIVSGVASSVLTIGLLPFFEAGFGILSSIKLLELSNPNHPLLRKILTEAPGTYHHSVMVANLADSACEAIEANGLLARVGSYYHDIGKTKRPQFFIENQMNIENPHDRLPSATSRDIIIAHVKDGAEMLLKCKMPQEIIDIAEQHHGTTLLKFFYHKALKQGEDVKEEEYRYYGPKAQTKEIAVIGIADSVEAAVRSMVHPTPEKIVELVEKIISDRMNDHQFDECDITMKELSVVKQSLCETLNGIFHSRIEYPEFPKLEQKVRP